MNVAPVRCAARSATASSTGCTSVGEAEVTRRISLIAVCCSSASFVWLKRRTFSIAIAAWSAKVLTRSTFSAANARASIRHSWIAPMARSSRMRGTASAVWWPTRRCSSRPTGYSDSGASARSSICIATPSITARPATEPRVSGIVSPGSSVLVPPNEAAQRSTLPSTRTIVACAASQSVSARSATACSIGETSPGVPEITRRISLIAVCCSSASRVRLNRRTLSIAIAACRANVSSSATWSGEKWPGTGRQTNSAP